MLCASLRRCFFQGLHGASSSLATLPTHHHPTSFLPCQAQIPDARTVAGILTTTCRTAIPPPAVGLAARMEARFVVIVSLQCQIYGHREPSATITRFSPNGEWVASADASGTVTIWGT
ncbi:hypothetical protein LR48_Vigan404s002800 [Vigna angularis]|uniref:Anaphase-promoting complex subunit 4 WD40 domain-containing protein n=1 Tax=Phaseolus angularis TaxID=3914 RepID=A0A0L9T9E0_PHAAN|nr:hypothetical protein LR48_Vigan404s002800 [Vigna angularis]